MATIRALSVILPVLSTITLLWPESGECNNGRRVSCACSQYLILILCGFGVGLLVVSLQRCYQICLNATVSLSQCLNKWCCVYVSQEMALTQISADYLCQSSTPLKWVSNQSFLRFIEVNFVVKSSLLICLIDDVPKFRLRGALQFRGGRESSVYLAQNQLSEKDRNTLKVRTHVPFVGTWRC